MFSKIKLWMDFIGSKFIDFCAESVLVTKFIGRAFAGIGHIFTHRKVFRTNDLWVELAHAGIHAVPIIVLISFMIGMIMAFVGVTQLKLFGAEIFVALLVTVTMNRIMGAIMTCIIMTGRTGASYAAEIGSMKINDEIDALHTMGINTVDYLVVPRMIALTFMMPILTTIADIVGILGGAFVSIYVMGMSGPEYWATTIDAISMRQFTIGLMHSFLYGIVISLTGCWYGFRTEKSADAIGRATTRSVVSSIVWCTILTAIITVFLSMSGI